MHTALPLTGEVKPFWLEAETGAAYNLETSQLEQNFCEYIIYIHVQNLT